MFNSEFKKAYDFVYFWFIEKRILFFKTFQVYTNESYDHDSDNLIKCRLTSLETLSTHGISLPLSFRVCDTEIHFQAFIAGISLHTELSESSLFDRRICAAI